MPRTKNRKPGAAARARREAAASKAASSKAEKCSSNTKSTKPALDLGDTIYFYKPNTAHGIFSQWYQSTFTCPSSGHQYTNAEQYMMHRKALLFDPESDLCQKILSVDDPAELKRMGRLVKNFDPEVWERKREEIVSDGNYLKFTQNTELKKFLLETGDKQLVEAAPRDRIWGIGFAEGKVPYDRKRWGKNLLGKALMTVRDRIQKELNVSGPGGDEFENGVNHNSEEKVLSEGQA